MSANALTTLRLLVTFAYMLISRSRSEGDSTEGPANRLLLSLSPPVREQVLKFATSTDLPSKQMLLRTGHRPRFVYFLTSGLASHVVQFAKGGSVEVGMEGNEGCVGALRLIGGNHSGPDCFMLVHGGGYRLGFDQAHALFCTSEEFRTRLLEFAQHQFSTLAQQSACNRLHLLEQRLARWLLMVRDRVGSHKLGLTQELLALMLGTQRTSVVIAVNEFQKRNLTRNGRGWIEILDQENLMRTACECYRDSKEKFENIYRTGS